MKFPFTIVEQGIEFTFERRNCEEKWSQGWNSKNYRTYKCSGFWKGVGKGHASFVSQRIGVCRKHKANDFTEATIQEWRDDPAMQKHVAKVKAYLWQEVNRQDLADELGYKKSIYVHWDDVIHNTHDNTYSVSLKGLTRQDAITIYKMADALKAEREETQ